MHKFNVQGKIGKHTPAGAALLVLILILVACTGVGPENTSVAPPASPTRAASATTAPTEAPVTPFPSLNATDTMGAATLPPAVEQPTPAQPPTAATLPDVSGLSWKTVASGLVRPTSLVAAGDGSGRLFVLEQRGVVRIVQNGSVGSDPFLDIRDRIGIEGNEQGLLGIAFHPQYLQNGYFYLDYTDRNGNTVVARYTVLSTDPNRADPASEKVLLQVKQPYANHNGGEIAFGPDGYLYIALGDGGSANDPRGNAQSLKTLLGKILRIDVDHGDPYAIPGDNPFVGSSAPSGALPEIYFYGLRNPWRFSFDPATGDLYIADVGQNTWEEVDYWPWGSGGGANFGWNIREGAHPFQGEPPPGVQLVEPVAEYQHPGGCSITGGYVYRGAGLPELQGVYLYSDYCAGKVWGLLRHADGSWENRLLFETGMNPSSFGLDEQGEIYLVDQKSGSISRLSR